jgi:hypothetical protein
MNNSRPLMPLALLLLTASACCFTPRPAAATVPDVMISVEATDPAMAAPDDVVISYPGRTSAAVMQRDIAALRRETGWVVQNPRLEGATAEFTTQNTINRTTGRLPVAAVVTAFRHYHRLIVVFDVLGPFTYTGHTYYHDANVQIAMEPQVAGSRTFGFNVTVAGSTSGPISMGDETAPPSPLSPVRVLLALLAAGLVGIAVYLLFLRIITRTEPAANPCDK